MAANQLVQARIDGAVKEEAAAVLATMGLTVFPASQRCQTAPSSVARTRLVRMTG